MRFLNFLEEIKISCFLEINITHRRMTAWLMEYKLKLWKSHLASHLHFSDSKSFIELEDEEYVVLCRPVRKAAERI
jgi:hypothetical protein